MVKPSSEYWSNLVLCRLLFFSNQFCNASLQLYILVGLSLWGSFFFYHFIQILVSVQHVWLVAVFKNFILSTQFNRVKDQQIILLWRGVGACSQYVVIIFSVWVIQIKTFFKHLGGKLSSNNSKPIRVLSPNIQKA